MNLMESGTLTRAEVYSALSGGVDSIHGFCQALSSRNPAKSKVILTEFANSGCLTEQTRMVIQNNLNETMKVYMHYNDSGAPGCIIIPPHNSRTIYGLDIVADDIDDLRYYENGAPYEIEITTVNSLGGERTIFYNIEDECEFDFRDSYFDINSWDVSTEYPHRGNILKTFRYIVTYDKIYN